MILRAIMDQLATGSITKIITRGNMETYPAGDELLTPFVIVFDDFGVRPWNGIWKAAYTLCDELDLDRRSVKVGTRQGFLTKF